MNTIQKAIIKLYEDSGFEKVQTYFSENEKQILSFSKVDLEETYLLLIRLSIITENLDFAKKIIDRIEFENLKSSADILELLRDQFNRKSKNIQKQEKYTATANINKIKIPYGWGNKETEIEAVQIINFSGMTDAIIVSNYFTYSELQKVSDYSSWYIMNGDDISIYNKITSENIRTGYICKKNKIRKNQL